MENFKSILAINESLNNINNVLDEMSASITTFNSFGEELNNVWQSSSADMVKEKIVELSSNLSKLNVSINNIRIKIDNAKSGAVSANETKFDTIG